MKKSVFIGMTALLMGLTACEHKELCYHHPHTAKVRVNVDWNEFTKEQPTGMTVTAYPVDGGQAVSTLTHTLSHAYFNLEAGAYHTLTYNQSPSEFGTLLFKGMDRFETAEVVSGEQDSRWYQGRSEGERVAVQAEWLATDRETDARVTEEMVRETLEHEKRSAPEYVMAHHTPRNIIYTVHVRVNIQGIYNLRSARAALDGMSEGYRFSDGYYKDEVMTHLLEEWKMTVDKDDYRKGYIDATFYCFGLPGNHRGDADANQLTLSLLLVDNKTILDFPIAVGDKFVTVDAKELILSLEVDLDATLPDVKPEGGSSAGFDAVVEDWGDEEEHVIPM